MSKEAQRYDDYNVERSPIRHVYLVNGQKLGKVGYDYARYLLGGLKNKEAGGAFAEAERLAKELEKKRAEEEEAKRKAEEEAKLKAEGKPLTETEASEVLERMKAGATNDPGITLSDESWSASFGEDNSIETPLGVIKMGDGQKQKFVDKGQEEQFGMAVETLRDPDVVFMEPSKAKEGQTAERGYSLVYVKTFVRNGEKVHFFASVTNLIDGLEISTSSHIIKDKSMNEKLQTFERAYTKETLLPNSSDRHLAEHRDDVPDLLPTQGKSAESNASSDKGSDTSSAGQVLSFADCLVAARERVAKEGFAINDDDRVAFLHGKYAQEAKERLDDAKAGNDEKELKNAQKAYDRNLQNYERDVAKLIYKERLKELTIDELAALSDNLRERREKFDANNNSSFGFSCELKKVRKKRL